MVKRGFTKAYGAKLRHILSAGTKSRPRAFASGLIVTGLLQSSTATALLLTSFAKKGAIPLSASLAVIIGADISTTLVAQILSFDLSWLSPALIIAGYITDTTAPKEGKRKYIARIFIGLGFMLLALTLIRAAAAPIGQSDILPLIIGPLYNDPALTILVAALITWVIHSSLASVLLFASLATNGIIDLPMGILLVLGANLGGALIPLASTWKDGAAARQITFGNLLMRGVILLATLPFLHLIPDGLSFLSENTPRQLIHAHTGFNIILALIFLPLVTVVAKPCAALFKPENDDDNTIKPLYLDEHAIDMPSIAIPAAARETLHMAELVQDMLNETMRAIQKNDHALIRNIKETEDNVDTLYKAIKLYLARVSQDGMDIKSANRSIQILTFTTNLEHIGDIIDKSLMELAAKKIRKQEKFSEEGFQEIKSLHENVMKNMALAQTIFMSESNELAEQLIDEKRNIRKKAEDSADRHFKRLQEGVTQTIATSSLHLDIIRDYKRINSYLTHIAYAVLKGKE